VFCKNTNNFLKKQTIYRKKCKMACSCKSKTSSNQVTSVQKVPKKAPATKPVSGVIRRSVLKSPIYRRPI